MTLLDVMTDAELWGGTLGGPSWKVWRTFVAASQGLALDAEGLALYQRCTGRQIAPQRPARVIAALCGRRSGKSIVAAFLACAHAVLSKPKLAPGEKPVVLVCAPTQRQARVLHDYCAGLLESSDLTRAEIVNRTAGRIELASGVSIEIRSSDFKKVRGITAIACLADESAFLRSEDSATPDVELYRALRPALATTGGPFIAD